MIRNQQDMTFQVSLKAGVMDVTDLSLNRTSGL